MRILPKSEDIAMEPEDILLEDEHVQRPVAKVAKFQNNQCTLTYKFRSY